MGEIRRGSGGGVGGVAGTSFRPSTFRARGSGEGAIEGLRTISADEARTRGVQDSIEAQLSGLCELVIAAGLELDRAKLDEWAEPYHHTAGLEHVVAIAPCLDSFHPPSVEVDRRIVCVHHPNQVVPSVFDAFAQPNLSAQAPPLLAARMWRRSSSIRESMRSFPVRPSKSEKMPPVISPP